LKAVLDEHADRLVPGPGRLPDYLIHDSNEAVAERLEAFGDEFERLARTAEQKQLGSRLSGIRRRIYRSRQGRLPEDARGEGGIRRLGTPGKRGSIRIDSDEPDGFLAALKQRRGEPPPLSPRRPPITLNHIVLD
jgi:hypothetical protein